MIQDEHLSIVEKADSPPPLRYQTLLWIAGAEAAVIIFLIFLFCILGGVWVAGSDCDCSASHPPTTPIPTPSVTCSTTPSPSSILSPQPYFFQLSDVHTNVNYSDPSFPLASYGNDGGMLLLNTVMESMQSLSGAPEFILLTGDMPAHDLDGEQEQFDTISAVCNVISDSFPGLKVYPSLGNNDVYPDYYFPLNTESPWMENLAAYWQSLGWLDDAQVATFNPSGYYSVPELWVGGPKLLSLNTLLYSVRLRATSSVIPTPVEDLPDDPNGQFAWIREELDDCVAKGQQALFAYHIPSGVNGYDGKATWHEKFTVTFGDICEQYHDTILAQVAAHYHTDEFRLLSGPSAVFLNPSVSPVHTNNPSFRQFLLHEGTGAIDNYVQYFTDLTASNSKLSNGNSAQFQTTYDFNSAYNANGISASSLEEVVENIGSSAEFYMKYLVQQYANFPYHRGENVCSVNFQLEASYDTCNNYFEDDE